MAEGSSLSDSEGLEIQLQSLLSRYSGDKLRTDSEPFCSDFCELVQEYASRWRVPLPQLRILEISLCYFSQASTFFTTNCDHVQHTISSLALSIFELLLFFDQKDFNEEPLKKFTATFQECHSVLGKFQNVHLLHAERLVQGGGPWSDPALQAILSDSILPQNEVDGCISSELPVFVELRVLYLLSCGRVNEALSLAKSCVRHPVAGQHSFFLQVYLSWLHKTSQYDRLYKEVADINGKDAVDVICSLEDEETDDLLLALSMAFLSQQLQRGDMYYLCDLVCVWMNLHGRLKTSKQVLLEECRQLMLTATNVKSIFPFIRAILQEVGEEGIQFCVELCANALRFCLPCDVLTKTLIYKTVAGLLPNDLEVCRACALLVFFLERTVESYKIVYLLYMHPDQEYYMDDSPIGNNVRFETLQVLKKDLYFDPEFWNLFALRTNCLKLLREKVVSAALEEIMEDKWISKYCTKEPALRSRASVCHRRNKVHAAAKKRNHQEAKVYKKDSDTESKRLKMGLEKTRLNDHSLRRKGSQAMKKSPSAPLRRSFWQLDRIHSSLTLRYDDHRRTTRFSEKNPPKRRIKKPKWLLEDSGALEENLPLKMKRNELKQKRHLQSCVMKRSQAESIKNNSKLKPPVKTLLKARENEYQNGCSSKLAQPPQVILELSLPDNELMDTFAEDACSRPRGFPQVLLYKRTVKFPDTSPPSKTLHRNEVILRARDANMFLQQLHCYTRRQKGNGLNTHGSVSTITRSSAQGSPSKDSPGELCEKPVSESKGSTATQTIKTDVGSQVSEKGLKDPNKKAGSRKPSSTGELPEKSESTGAEKDSKSPDSKRITQRQTTGKVLQNNVCTRDPCETSSIEVKGSTKSQTSAATEATDVTSVVEIFEEPAVEMKVTFASQSPVLDKVSKTPTGDDVSNAELSQTTKLVRNKKKTTEESVSISLDVSNTGDADLILSDCQDVELESGDLELKSVSSHDTDKNKSVDSQVSTTDLAEDSQKNSQVNVPCKNDRSPEKNAVHLCKLSETKDSYTSTDSVGESDRSALTVSELAPKRLDQAQEEDKHQASGSSAFKESRGESRLKAGQRKRTTSICSAPELDASVADMKEKARIQDPNSPEDSEFTETVPEPEEAKLEHFCTYCNKDFKGPRVVEHAMFHYRKDECTFCRMVFKDDLLAMMHLSDHIEKLKRIKEPPSGSKTQKNEVITTPKTSTKAKTMNTPSGTQSNSKVKLSVCSESIINVNPPESRTLRSNLKQTSGTPSHENQKSSERINSKAAIHRINGHIGTKTETSRLKKDFDGKKESIQQESAQRTLSRAGTSRFQEKEHVEMDSTTSVQSDKNFSYSADGTKKKSLQDLKTTSKQNGNVPEKKTVEQQEKLCCPVDGCSWFTDLSKNRVTFLYHTLEKHYSEVKPLELAFRVANGKCSICMRVLWSFEHFLHHVERHRLIPRHPCLHQGCTARFKTGMEMRRHARKHSPLQATCCLPGCSQLFICLWALNLHERDHYSSKSEKNTEDNPEPTADSENANSTRRLREQATNDARKNITDPPVSTRTASLKSKGNVKNSNTTSDVSSKDTSIQHAVPNLRLRKVQVTKTTRDVPKVISSSLKYSSNFRLKLRKKQVKVNTKDFKRRALLPRMTKATHDENRSASQKQSAQLTKIKNHRATSDKSKKNKIAKLKVKSKVNKLCQKQSIPSASIKTATSKSTVPQKATGSSADKVKIEVEKPDLTQIDPSNSVLFTALENLNLPPFTESVQKEEYENSATSNSSRETKKSKEPRKRLDPKSKEKTIPKSKSDPKQHDKAKEAAVILQGLQKLLKSSLDEKGKRKEVSHAAPSASTPSTLTDVINETCSSTGSEENKLKSEAGKASKKRKEIPSDDLKKAARKKRKKSDQSATKKASKPSAEVQPTAGETCADKTSETLLAATDVCSCSEIIDGQPSVSDAQFTPCKETLAEYSKRPYSRLPPTAYLDEKYITMPKRRKDMFFHLCQPSVSPKPVCVKSALQRQRCVKCFATFDSAEELQSHVQLQKCSNLFGFDSDDEGNS